MPTTENTNTTVALQALAARHRELAYETDIRALMAVRTDPEKVQRTEEAFRGLIAKQAKQRRHARRLEKAIEASR